MMEQEHDPLLLEQDHLANTYNSSNNGHGKLVSYWTNATSSLKLFVLGRQKTTSSHHKLMEHKEDNDEDSDGSDFDLYENEDWYAASPPPSSFWQRRCGRVLRWTLCLCLALPLGLLLLVFILYALVFRPPPLHSALGSTTALANFTEPARLLTYNIFMRPPGVKNNANDYKNDRLKHIITAILPHYDIITFQEAFAFGNHRIDRLIEAAQHEGFGYIMSPRHGPWELAADGGLLLLSRYPLLQADILEYPRGLHSDWLSYKGAIHALIGLDNATQVHVYTTHTQASYGKGGTRSQQDIQMRLDQFGHFHDFILATTQGDDRTPIVAMGDFNIDSVDHTNGSITDLPIHHSQAYTRMMEVLQGGGSKTFSLVDMAYTTFGYHPVTFGDYVMDGDRVIPAETVLTQAQQVLTVQSIDQLLWSPLNSSLVLSNVTVEKFLVKDQPFTQLSDHYGFSCLLTR